MEKINIFQKELEFIEDTKIQEITKNLIRQLPDYFFEVAASSTGKYHPQYALGFQGLIRHTQAAVRIANDLLQLETFRGLSKDKDYIIAALILHDGIKHGWENSKYSVANHPILASNFVINNIPPEEDTEPYRKIAELIETHMGQFNTDYKNGLEILKKPSTKAQSFVHLCDYLASRKYLEFIFEV